jgi:hypothetical protein
MSDDGSVRCGTRLLRLSRFVRCRVRVVELSTCLRQPSNPHHHLSLPACVCARLTANSGYMSPCQSSPLMLNRYKTGTSSVGSESDYPASGQASRMTVRTAFVVVLVLLALIIRYCCDGSTALARLLRAMTTRQSAPRSDHGTVARNFSPSSPRSSWVWSKKQQSEVRRQHS